MALGGAPKQEVMGSISAKGVDSVIEEHDRPHLNEAALVAGSNPEVDELEAEAAGKKPRGGIDRPAIAAGAGPGDIDLDLPGKNPARSKRRGVGGNCVFGRIAEGALWR